MRSPSKIAACVAASIAAVALAACGGDDSGTAADDGQQKYELSYATYVNEKDTFARQAQWFMDQVEQRTDGRVKFKPFYSESLLAADEIFAGIKDGRADMGHVANVYSPGELPLSQISVPFLSTNGYAVSQALSDIYDRDGPLREEWAAQGARVLAFGIVGSAAIGTSEPVESLEQLDGKQLRAVGLTGEAREDVGAEPTAIAAPEIYEGIQRGLLDGFAGLPLQTALQMKMQEVAPHFLDTGMGVFAVVGVVTVSERAFERLPEDVQQTMVEVGRESLGRAAKIIVEADEAACEELLAAGGSVTALPASERTAWRDRLFEQKILPRWQKDAEQAGADPAEVEQFRDDFLAAVRKHEQASKFVDGLRACSEQAG